jgi:hypothetical protein
MKGKQRLSASVDADLLEAAQTAVDEGQADSISAWVNDALRLKAEHDRRMRALDSFLAAYETEHGPISQTEIDQAVRRSRARATVVRSKVAKNQVKSKQGLA